MGNTILVIAPHPDDEVLGCSGTILKHIAAGDSVHWCIASTMDESSFDAKRIAKRQEEIQTVKDMLGFATVIQFDFAATTLDTISKSDFVAAFKAVFDKIQPHTVYLPHPADIHSDHAATFEAAIACTKSFRCPSVKRILCYEVLSETDFQIHPAQAHFQANVFIDITAHLDQKIEAMKVYESELADFPFPRSVEAMEALAKVRGAACGAKAAEAFQLLKDIA